MIIIVPVLLMICLSLVAEAYKRPSSFVSYQSSLNGRLSTTSQCMQVEPDMPETSSMQNTAETTLTSVQRKELWKDISKLEKRAVALLQEGNEESNEEAYKLFAESVCKKKMDPFIDLSEKYGAAVKDGVLTEEATQRFLSDVKKVGLPPHLIALGKKSDLLAVNEEEEVHEEVDIGSTFSDTVTEKIRVKVSSFYDKDKSDPVNGKYMFWYKVGIYNEGPEPVQIVARMWEIEKCRGEKETVRGAGIMNSQPIIPPGDVFTYQSVCPLKVFPPKGKRILGSMEGGYTLCKGNMGQNNFIAKVGKFNLILPEDAV